MYNAPLMKRKIIQICVTPDTETENAVTYALCDDGTVWSLCDRACAEWVKMKPIPQSK